MSNSATVKYTSFLFVKALLNSPCVLLIIEGLWEGLNLIIQIVLVDSITTALYFVELRSLQSHCANLTRDAALSLGSISLMPQVMRD